MLCRVMCALLFVAWVGEWPREIDSVMYSGLWRSPFVVFGPLFVPLPGIRMFTWQLLLVALAPACLAWPGAFRRRAPAMDAAIVASFGAIAVTFLWGWMRGGSAYHAYFQLWRFLTALLVALLLLSVIRTSRDLRALAVTILVAALIRGTLVMYFYWVHVHGKYVSPPEYMTNHDDSLLFVAAILILGSWAFVRGRVLAWAVASPVFLHQFYAIVLNDRRIAWVELATAMIAVYVIIGPGRWRRRLNRWLIVAAPVVLLYVAVGWGRQGAIFAPIQALSSAGSNEDPSSLARQEEVRNLLYTMSVAGNPLLGTGWGVPYRKLTSIYANYSAEWVLALYTPHNSLLGLAAFAGLAGILGIWVVVPVAAFLAARGYNRSTHPIDRAAAMVAAGLLPAFSVHCFGDIGFQSFPGGLILGVTLATAGKLAAWAAVPASAARAAARVGDERGPRRAVA
jgi:hypothetical protein